MASPSESLRELLRGRVLRGVAAGALRAGDRLPSARELAREFGVDHRAIVAAYRELDSEGVVELRPRGGVYVRGTAGEPSQPAPPLGWLTEVYAQGLARGVPVPALPEWLFRSVETRRLRAVVVAPTADQAAGLCRELREDFGLDASAIVPGDLEASGDPAVRIADLFVTTAAHEAVVRRVAALLERPVIVASVRPDLMDGEWRLLLRRPVYVIVAEAQFEAVLREFLSDFPGVENLRVVPADPAAVQEIPHDATTYVTRGARERLDGVEIPGRILPAARVLSEATTREVVSFILRENLAALGGALPGRRNGS